MSAATDEELVRRSKEDDERAFGELVSRYETKVYSLALRMVRNPEDAEDVLQDTFLRAYRGIKSFQGASTFSTWIYRITANSALMRLRKKQLPTVSIEDQDERETPVNIADWTPFRRDPVQELSDACNKEGDPLRRLLLPAAHAETLVPWWNSICHRPSRMIQTELRRD